MDRTQGKEPGLDDRGYFQSFRTLCAAAAQALHKTDYDYTSYISTLVILGLWIDDELHRLHSTAPPF